MELMSSIFFQKIKNFQKESIVFFKAKDILFADAFEAADISVVAKVAELNLHGVSVSKDALLIFVIGLTGHLRKSFNSSNDPVSATDSTEIFPGCAGIFDNVMKQSNALELLVI